MLQRRHAGHARLFRHLSLIHILIERYHQENPLVNGVDLSRNRGHQNALLAGLMTCLLYTSLLASARDAAEMYQDEGPVQNLQQAIAQLK